MKRIFCVLLVLLLSPAVYAANALPEPHVVKINERVYALLGPVGLPDKQNQGYASNSTAIIGDKGVILVDTGFTDEIGAHLAKAIARITPKPVTHIINTHFHGDHLLGNSAFRNVEIISTVQCRELLDKHGHEWVAMAEGMAGRKFPNTRPVPANVTFNENTRTEKTINGVKLILWAPQGSHTDGDLMVYLPEDGVLIGGDILVNQITPNFRDGHVKNWIGTLEQLKNTKAKTFVPGHGPLMTTADVAAFHKRMAALYAGVQAGYKKGLNDSEIRNTLDLSGWKNKPLYDDVMGTNINRTYLEVEAADF